MTPQELEALLDLGGRYELIGDHKQADLVRRRILGKLAPSLLALWMADVEVERANGVVKMARCATAADYAPLLKQLQDARAARRAALARLREVKP